VRNRTSVCTATVKQEGDTFTAGHQPHNHSSQPGLLNKIRITAQVTVIIDGYIVSFNIRNDLFNCKRFLHNITTLMIFNYRQQHVCLQVKAKAKEKTNVFVPSSAIVEDAMPPTDASAPESSRPKPQNLIRIANRARQGLRPSEPRDLAFEVSINFLLNDKNS